MSPTRRDTLRALAGGALAMGTPQLFSSALAATPPVDLAVIRGGSAAARVQAAIDALGGMGQFVKRGEKVVIKPNMGFGYTPERGATTEPQVVRALCEMALNAGARQVLVFDNPCHAPNIAVETCGVPKALAGLDQVTIYTLRSDDLFREVPLPAGKALKKQDVARDILECDALINVPTAKSHGSAKVSFGMKNWMGVVKERRYWHAFVDLDQAIADIATLIRPRLTVLDATRALVTGGPGGPGRVDTLKTVVAGTDPVAVDAFALTLAPWGGSGLTVDQVKYIGMARSLGVGQLEPAQKYEASI